MAWFRRNVEERSISVGEIFPDARPATFADVRVNPDQALRLSAVWSCVNLLSNTISTLPLKAHRRDGEEFTPPLLISPAAGWTLSDWLEAIMRSLLLRGNAYGFVTARAGPRLSPTQVELVDPDLMSVTVDPDGAVTYRFRGEEVDPSNLVHIKAYRYPGSPVGLAPVTYAAESIGLGLSTRRFGQQYFSEGAMPTGVLNIPQQSHQDFVDAVKHRIMASTRGKREPLVVSGDVTWTQLSVTPEQSQFLDSMRFNVAEVCRIFGVPPEMVGSDAGDSNTYANLEGRSLHFLQYSLNPWLVRLENAISELLPRGSFVKFTTGGLLKATTKERYDAYAVALASGFRTIDEVRDLEDLAPLEGEQ